MADSPQVRRILYMHPAHRSVGVSGFASSFRSSRPAESLEKAELRVLLVPAANDRRIAAAIEAFEQSVARNTDLHCERADFSAGARRLANADCAIVFGRGLQIVGHWSDLDADLVEAGGWEDSEAFDAEVEAASAARQHQLVQGVGRFIAVYQPAYLSSLHQDITCLLVRRWAGREFPVAWAQEHAGRAFYTVLGASHDFRRREFVRLLQNAIEWIAAD